MLEDFRLRVFLQLAESGSFTATARNLGISQPAVSQNISLLEQAVGEPLFIRMRGFATLTGKGEEFRFYAKKILHWYDRMDAELIKGSSPAPETLRLKISDGTEAEISVDDGAIGIRITSA